MSADNWTECPRCLESHEIETKRLKKELEEGYGSMPIDGFYELKHQIDTRSEHIDTTLREDYEIGLDGSFVYVSYSCSCRECGLHKKYTNNQLMNINPTPTA